MKRFGANLLVLLATASSGVAQAVDIETVRAWFIAESERAAQDQLLGCVDIELERENFPRMTDAELNERWQAAQDRPDHPDGMVLRMELAMRSGTFRQRLRLIYASPEQARVAWDIPVPERVAGLSTAPMTDLEASSKVVMEKSDVGLSDGIIWQGNDLAIGVMRADAAIDTNPKGSLASSVLLVRYLMFPGVKDYSAEAFRSAVMHVDANGNFEVELGPTGFRGKLRPYRRLQGHWNEQAVRSLVRVQELFESAEDLRQGKPVVRIRFDNWSVAKDALWMMPFTVREEASVRLYERASTGLRPINTITIKALASIACDQVRQAAQPPRVVEGNGGFDLVDSVRSDWKVAAVQNLVEGRTYSFDAASKQEVTERVVGQRGKVVRPAEPANVLLNGASTTVGSRSWLWIISAASIGCIASVIFYVRYTRR